MTTAKSSRRIRMSTSWVLRTADSSTDDTHAATAFPPATAYGIFAAFSAAVARNSRWRTFSTAFTMRWREICEAEGSGISRDHACVTGLERHRLIHPIILLQNLLAVEARQMLGAG